MQIATGRGMEGMVDRAVIGDVVMQLLLIGPTLTSWWPGARPKMHALVVLGDLDYKNKDIIRGGKKIDGANAVWDLRMAICN